MASHACPKSRSSSLDAHDALSTVGDDEDLEAASADIAQDFLPADRSIQESRFQRRDLDVLEVAQRELSDLLEVGGQHGPARLDPCQRGSLLDHG
jgi:hypothetical protein